MDNVLAGGCLPAVFDPAPGSRSLGLGHSAMPRRSDLGHLHSAGLRGLLVIQ